LCRIRNGQRRRRTQHNQTNIHLYPMLTPW
jgi:hypothetical protein